MRTTPYCPFCAYFGVVTQPIDDQDGEHASLICNVPACEDCAIVADQFAPEGVPQVLLAWLEARNRSQKKSQGR